MTAIDPHEVEETVKVYTIFGDIAKKSMDLVIMTIEALEDRGYYSVRAELDTTNPEQCAVEVIVIQLVDFMMERNRMRDPDDQLLCTYWERPQRDSHDTKDIAAIFTFDPSDLLEMETELKGLGYLKKMGHAV